MTDETTNVPPDKENISDWDAVKKRVFRCGIFAITTLAILFPAAIVAMILGYVFNIPSILLPFEFLFHLFLGWLIFLLKSIFRVTVSLPGVITFVVVLALFTTGIHFAGRHWYRLRSSVNKTIPLRRWQLKRTVQIVLTIVLLFASGISIVGVAHQGAWLMTSKKRWTRYESSGSLSETARRASCKNNMKQIGLALHNYHDTFHTFPPGGMFNETGRPMHSWATMILPFIDQAPLYKQIDFSQPWNAPQNAKPFQEILPALTCSSSVHPDENELGQAITSYAGNSKVFSVNKQIRIKDITDGTSNTFFAGEVNSHFKPWGNPVNFRDPALGINYKKKISFGSRHVGGAHFLFGDGRVRFISENIDPTILKALSTPNKGDAIGDY